MPTINENESFQEEKDNGTEEKTTKLCSESIEVRHSVALRTGHVASFITSIRKPIKEGAEILAEHKRLKELPSGTLSPGEIVIQRCSA